MSHNIDAIVRAMYEVAEDAAADGVRYLEVRFSPILHVKEGMGLSEVMEAAAEGLVMAENKLPITVRILVCGMRNLPSDVTEKLAQIAWRYRNKVTNLLYHTLCLIVYDVTTDCLVYYWILLLCF